jgi:uncharacterized damage-inducible protein DinB
MKISEILLSEFDQEMTNTRSMLERVPLLQAEYKPHAKSMTLGRLSGHIAELAGWGAIIISQDALDLTPMVEAGHKGFAASSPDELLHVFDKGVAEVRNVLTQAEDPHFNQVWSIQLKGKTVFSLPRLSAFRIMFLNHLIHHRGQLGVYLRLNDIPLPALYGPSADEGKSLFDA